MSYGKHPNKWSRCSRDDFTSHYNKERRHWCLRPTYNYHPNAVGDHSLYTESEADYLFGDQDQESKYHPYHLNEVDYSLPHHPHHYIKTYPPITTYNILHN